MPMPAILLRRISLVRSADGTFSGFIRCFRPRNSDEPYVVVNGPLHRRGVVENLAREVWTGREPVFDTYRALGREH